MQDPMHTIVSLGLVLIIVLALARMVLDLLESRKRDGVRNLAHATAGVSRSDAMRVPPRNAGPRYTATRSSTANGWTRPAAHTGTGNGWARPASMPSQPQPGTGTYRARPTAAERALPEDHPYGRSQVNDFVRLAPPPKPEPNYYALLGVRPLSTVDELERAFRRRVMEIHPDHHFGDAARYKEGIEHLKELNAAMLVLRDPFTRMQYDIRRGNAGPSPGLRARILGR